jgi:hypothetical protein
MLIGRGIREKQGVAAAVVALALGFALSGCGQGDDGAPQQANAAAGTSAGVVAGQSSKQEAKAGPGKRHRDKADSKQSSSQGKPSTSDSPARSSADAPKSKRKGKRHLTRAEVFRRLPVKYRARAVRHYVRVVLSALDLKSASVLVPRGGASFKVTLTEKLACRAHPDEAERILKGVQDAVPYPRTATVVVATATGEVPISVFGSGDCEPLEPPAGTGRVVFRASGERGSETTKPFRITTKRWTVEYANRGTYFQVWAFKGKKGQPNPIGRRSPGSGKQVYKGPGTFTLNISSLGDWVVRIRENP